MITELILKPILNHELIGNHLYWKRCGCAGSDKATRTRLTPSCVLEAGFVDRKLNFSDLIRRGVSEVSFALSSYKLRGLFRTARLYRYRWSISMAGSRGFRENALLYLPICYRMTKAELTFGSIWLRPMGTKGVRKTETTSP